MGWSLCCLTAFAKLFSESWAASCLRGVLVEPVPVEIGISRQENRIARDSCTCAARQEGEVRKVFNVEDDFLVY